MKTLLLIVGTTIALTFVLISGSMWYASIRMANDNKVSGWASYDYVVCAATSYKYWRHDPKETYWVGQPGKDWEYDYWLNNSHIVLDGVGVKLSYFDYLHYYYWLYRRNSLVKWEHTTDYQFPTCN